MAKEQAKDTKTRSFYVPKLLDKRVEKEAAETHRSVSQLICMFIEDGLNKKEGKAN